MGKRKGGRGGGRGGRHGGGRDGRKQSCFDPTLDTEMVDAPHQRGDWYNKSQTRTSFQTQHENSKRRRVGKATWDTFQTQQVSINQGSSSNGPRGWQPSIRANPSNLAFSTQNPFANTSRTKSRRASIGTCISALSTQVGRGSYCYKCTQTNRKLREALFELLERALNDGKNLIDEWAWEAGVSPDHMECERTKLHMLPEEGLQCKNEPYNKCEAEMSNRHQSGGGNISPPQTLCAPGLSGSRLPPPRIHQPEFVQLQQGVQAAPGAVEMQLPPLLELQVPSASYCNVPSAMSMAEQPAAYATHVGYHDQLPQAQAQPNIKGQQEQEPDSIHIWKVANGTPQGPTHQQPVYQYPTVDHIVEQARMESYCLNPVNQEQHWGNVYMSTQHTNSVEGAPSGPMLQAQKHPFQHLQHSSTTLANSAAPAHEEDHHNPMETRGRQQADRKALVTPPPSNKMTIPNMLNTASEAHSAQHQESAVVIGTSIEATSQDTEKRPGDGLNPAPCQAQSLLLIFPEQEQHLAEKYCCEVINLQ